MKIAVDARELAGRPTGVGRYLHELLAQWANDRLATRHTWRLLTPTPVPVPPAFAESVTIVPGSGGTVWEQWGLSRALGSSQADILFAPGYSAPLTAPCPTAVTIHDVSFAAHPEWFTWREGLRRRVLTAWSARRARVVLTDSQFSRDEIVRHIGISPSKINVIPLGVSAPMKPSPAGSSDLPAREPLIVFVGSIFRRRHVDRLIAAFMQRVAPRLPDSRLEIVGENRMFPPGDFADLLERADPAAAKRVIFRSYVDETSLRDLYRRAAVLAFLSEYEGFGLPPLEALAHGVPPVVFETTVAREVYGPAACYVPPLADTNAIGDALVELLTSAEARTRILTHAEAVLQRYDWATTAASTLQAIEEAAGA